MKESVLTKKIVKAIKDSRGDDAWVFKVHGDPRQRAGVPDLVICYRGVFVGIEIKVPGREHTLTELQAFTLEKIRQADGWACVATSPQEALDFLDRVDEEHGQ